MCTENSTSMIGRTHAENSDCWIGVEDPKKRKQIQDRLAQRARRKRLAEAKADNEASSNNNSNNTTITRRRRKKSTALPTPAAISGYSSTSNSESIPLFPVPLTVYTALWRNGQVLGLSCAIVTPSLSQEYGPDIPDSLQPTGLQLITVHPPWIDRFPFPQFRDNFISLLEVIDPEEFIADLFSRPSFTLKAKGVSWDPANWSIEEGFREKWGFLFDPGLFQLEGLKDV